MIPGLTAAITGGLARLLLAAAASNGIVLLDGDAEKYAQAFVFLGLGLWTVAQKIIANRNLKDAQAGLL